MWQHVARERLRLDERPEYDNAVGGSDTSRHSSEQRRMELDFVLALMDERPAERKTARQAAEEATFEIPTGTEDPAKTLHEVRAL